MAEGCVVSHTPGPWAADTHDVGGGSIQVYPEGHFLDPWIADVKCEHVGPKSRTEIEANACLIIAAPDLLAACRMALTQMRERRSFVDMPERPGDVEYVRSCLRDAIAKAEGETP
jgi:hypothetical protein